MPGANFQTAKPLPVKSTAVIGAGTMGSGIAVCLLNAGYQVFLLEQNEKVRVHRPKVMSIRIYRQWFCCLEIGRFKN
jgi:monoamine oxidase